MKILTYLVMGLCLLATVMSYPECQRTTQTTNIPCLIISSWNPGTCSNYNLTLYNGSGVLIVNTTFQNYNIVCSALFNQTVVGTYNYNSTIESGVITVEADSMLNFIFLLIPLALCFFFIYWSNSLKDQEEKEGQHDALRWFMRFLSLIMIFVVYGVANILIGQNPSYSAFSPLFNIWIYGWVFYTIMAVFLLFFLWKIFAAIKEKKKDDFERGVI